MKFENRVFFYKRKKNSGFQCTNNILYENYFIEEECDIPKRDESDIQEPDNV